MADLIIQPKNDDHLKLNNDAGTTILELANDESKLRLAQNNISASDGTTAITTSSANVTLAGTANNIGTVTSGTLSHGTTLQGYVDSSNTGVAFPNGHIIQVVSDVFSTESFTQSTGFATTGIDVDITPRTTSSKFFIITNTTSYNDGGHVHVSYYTIYRDSTDLGPSNSAGFANPYLGVSGGADLGSNVCISTLDSPPSLSLSTAITYEMRVRVNNAAYKSYWSMNGSESTITVMEIAQ